MTEYTDKPLVYIAGPYSSDPVRNTHLAIVAAEELEWGYNVAVHIPHLTMLWDLVSHAPVTKWYERDLHLLARCDALWRIEGASTGADMEIAFAREHDIPVFFAGNIREEMRFRNWRDRIWSPHVRRPH